MQSIVEPGGYCDKLERYGNNEMINEIQNKKELLPDQHEPNLSNTGINIAQRYISRLKEECENLILEYNSKGGRI